MDSEQPAEDHHIDDHDQDEYAGDDEHHNHDHDHDYGSDDDYHQDDQQSSTVITMLIMIWFSLHVESFLLYFTAIRKPSSFQVCSTNRKQVGISDPTIIVDP